MRSLTLIVLIHVTDFNDNLKVAEIGFWI